MTNFITKIYQQMTGVNPFAAATSTATTTTTTAAPPPFATVMAQLNNNLNNAIATSGVGTYGTQTGYNPITPVNTAQSTMITPDINAIVNLIKNSKSSVDVDTQVKEYLLSNYGGSKAAVIQNLAGVQNLPVQALSMQDMLFNQIATKISLQVRQNVFSGSKSSDISNFADDDSSSDSVSSSSASDFDLLD